MSDRNQIKERLSELIDGATDYELELLLITVRGVLRK